MRTPLENQTQFSTEEPFFEDPTALPVEPGEVRPPTPFLKRRKTIIALLVLVLCIGLASLFGYTQYVAWLRRIQPPPDITGPARSPITASELVEEAEVLARELKEADPDARLLTFPPIDLELRLENRPR